MLETLSVTILSLAVFGGIINDSWVHSPKASGGPGDSFFRNHDGDQKAHQPITAENDYQTDVDRLIALRSHPDGELLALANELEIKWRKIDWNQYARVMMHVCSEISNRKLNDLRMREQSEHFAREALSHSSMFLWEYQSSLVGWLGYRLSPSNAAWIRERREKAELWLQAWRRLEKEFDPTFDVNDRKQLPSMRVTPPFETGWFTPGHATFRDQRSKVAGSIRGSDCRKQQEI